MRQFIGVEGGRGGAPGAGAGPTRGVGLGRGCWPPLPVGTPSAPSDAYKLTLNLKMAGRPLFSTEDIPTRRYLKP